MISEDSITRISHLFCGDEGGYYSYKTGSRLVSFFNQYFGSNDEYKSGFPSRWVYVYNKIVDLLNSNNVDAFFNIILKKDYLIRDQGITEVAAAELSEKIVAEINRIIQQDLCKLTFARGRFHLMRESDDLVLIGSGGFANVYRQKSTGLVIKKLKDDFLTDAGSKVGLKESII